MPRQVKRNNYRRSKLEDDLEAQLQKAKVDYEYETIVLQYDYPYQLHKYTVDFVLPNGILIEAKGWLDKDDRMKMLNVKRCNPHVDIRFVFQNSKDKIYKGSKTTYAMWAEKHGFKWAHKTIPKEWLK